MCFKVLFMPEASTESLSTSVQASTATNAVSFEVDNFKKRARTAMHHEPGEAAPNKYAGHSTTSVCFAHDFFQQFPLLDVVLGSPTLARRSEGE